MPNREQRQAANRDADALGMGDAEEADLPCERPTLTLLNVIDNADGAGVAWWTVVNADPTDPVTVEATTAPHNSGVWGAITWTGPSVAAGIANWRNVPRRAVASHVVNAALNGPVHTVTIDVYDLVSLNCDLATRVGGLTWKAYAGHVVGNLATLTASTNPHHAPVWQHLSWLPAGTAGAHANEQAYDVSVAGDQQINVVLGNAQTGTKTLTATLHICQWPVLSVKKVVFNSLTVYNDGAAEIDTEFTKAWKLGLPAPAPGGVTANVQSVLCYAASKKIKVSVTFQVDTAPTETESVKIRGQATLGATNLQWAGTVRVTPASTEVTVADITSDVRIPAGVACHDPFTITWEMLDVDGVTWLAAGSSVNILYVTLASPKVTPYWTFLDLSCRGAQGATTKDLLVANSFAPFAAHTGDGNGMPRKGDGVRLSYYLDGTDTRGGDYPDNDVYYTRGILASADGTGRCGGWADILMHTWAIHGVSGKGQVRKLWLIRARKKNKHNGHHRFLVKNCVFNGVGTSAAAPYTHLGAVECVKNAGAHGQGKTNPQFDFGDHVVVMYGGQIYDPSYGIGPVATQAAYEVQAIDGLGLLQNGIPFNMGDGTPQFISDDCCTGYFVHKMGWTDSLTSIAAKYGRTAVDIQNDPLNRAVAGMPAPPRGTVLYIPRHWDANKTMLAGHLL